MFEPAKKSVRLRFPRVVYLFAATILVPGVLLAFYGLRAALQERRTLDRQMEEALQQAAAAVAQRLEQEFSEWQRSVDAVAAAPDETGWPARLREAARDPGSAIVLTSDGSRLRALPRGHLPYSLSAGPAGVPPPEPRHPEWARAETLELRQHAFGQAAQVYAGLLPAVPAAQRALVLHRLGRCLKKAGRTREAVAVFEELEKEPRVFIGPLPADLLALYEIAAADHAKAHRLYRGLAEGRWELEKASYLFYSQSAREWIGPEPSLLQVEQRKLALAAAVESFLAQRRNLLAAGGVTALAWWREQPFAAILLADPFHNSRLWTAPLRAPAGGGIQFAVLAEDGAALLGQRPPAGGPVATATARSGGLAVRIQAWNLDPAALHAAASRRLNLSFAMIGVVVALLAFGAYLTARAVRAELKVAELKSDFVSAVSHEFRSPLAGIHQLGEMLRDGRVRDEQRRREYYDMIVSETRRLRRLVENLLDFSRMEEGRKLYRFQTIDTAEWLRELAQDCESEAAALGFTLVAEVPEALPAVQGDPEALATAVRNLLDNAIKYSPESRTVWLEADGAGENVSIAVRDHGAGIRDEDLDHIFEKFFRGNGDMARSVKGAGLGLSLVQHIAAAHGGRVEVDSRLGHGSTFTLRLHARAAS